MTSSGIRQCGECAAYHKSVLRLHQQLLPVRYLARQSQFLAVHSSLGVSTVKELVEYVKKNPGLGYASSGVGSNQQVAGEWFAKEAGIKIEHAPYRGAGQAINDLIAAHVKTAFLGPTAIGQCLMLQ